MGGNALYLDGSVRWRQGHELDPQQRRFSSTSYNQILFR